MTNHQRNIGRGAIITACDLLEGIQTNARIESLVLELGLEEFAGGRGSIGKTVLALKSYASKHPDHRVETDYGEKFLSRALVDKAIELVGWKRENSHLWEKLKRYLELDGFALQEKIAERFGKVSVVIEGIIPALPASAQFQEAGSEIDALLAKFGLATARRHLDSARDNIVQSDWEAANGQCRTFLDAITDGIAEILFPVESGSKTSGLQRRQLLAEKGFLSREKHEFGDGGGQAFLPGLVKLLHPDGAHPGISNQDDALMRFQTVISTAWWLLKRLREWSRSGV